MELGEGWRATTADDTLRRAFPDPEMDDADWAPIVVPHHWRSHPDFAASDGPLLYRVPFDTSRPEAGTRQWLQFDGLFYQGDVWLDAAYLGDTEGYFFPHCFEVTAAMAARQEHLLAVELACDRPKKRQAKRNLTGVFQDWDCFDRDWNPGGIWRPVRVFDTGPVRIARLRVLCIEATAERATLEIRATLDAAAAGPVTVTTGVSPSSHTAATADTSSSTPTTADPVTNTTAVTPSSHTTASAAAAALATDHPLAAGANEVVWRVPVEAPALWWPHALGDQPLYDVTVRVAVQDRPSDAQTRRTGIRRIEMRDFVAAVNGERLFLKGANLGPSRRELSDSTAEELEGDVVLAKNTGLDLLRVHGHISRPELYDAADRHGVLLWQDLPLQWGYAGVRAQAVRQAGEAVDLLGHHPSVAVWCGHNEPPQLLDRAPDPVRFLARALPTWNRSVLDRSIQRALERADVTRPVVAHSGVPPHPAWGTDSHLYFGWYRGDERQFPGVLHRFPVLARFVSEFGAQAVPGEAEFLQPERWPDLDWPRLQSAYCLQKDRFDRYVPPAEYATFDAWRDATQAYQATVIRFQVETLRRLKFRPTGGFCQFSFADGQPAVSWAVLDVRRQPKAGYEALRQACAPVIVVADRPAVSYRAGEDMHLDVHVVNDLRTPLTDARCDATAQWAGGSRRWQFAGGVDADACARIGTLRLAVPPVEGPLLVDLVLTWAGGKATNRYSTRVTPR